MPWWTVRGVAIDRPPSKSRPKMSQDNKLQRYLAPCVDALLSARDPRLPAFAARSV